MARLFVAQIGSQQIVEQFGVEDAPIISMPAEMTEGLDGPIVIENGGRRLLKARNGDFRGVRARVRSAATSRALSSLSRT